jgi:pyridoxine/pyridoxamine 5'-phosphate oxidase
MKSSLETFQEIHNQIWKELGRATQDRHHTWRTPVLTTVGLDGSPNGRTVVLRRCDSHAGLFSIYTDSRSPKVTELKKNPQAQFVFWSTHLNWQLRVRAKVHVLTTGSLVESVWQQMRHTKSAGDYMTSQAPGTSFPSASTHVDQENLDTYFAILQAEVVAFDWLELSRFGHRRAQFCDNTWQWVSP